MPTHRLAAQADLNRRCPMVLGVVAAACIVMLSGCQFHKAEQRGETHAKLKRLLHPHRNPVFLENPLFVPECDREFIWQQLVDAVDDHFKIEREERMRVIGDVITPGEITTFPSSASTLLEPWRGNSVGVKSRLLSTLQTQRKSAKVFLTPTTGGYQVQVQVLMQQEDLDRPEGSTVGGASVRHDGTITRVEQLESENEPAHLGWIDVGRDKLLEQRILADIRDRLNVAWTKAPAASSLP